MLVISRRCDEKVVFPSLGVSVQVLGTKGRVVRLGIDAPQDVKVFRQELLPLDPAKISEFAGNSPLTHEQRNRLNKLSLSLHIFERYFEEGQTAKAQATLAKVMQILDSINEAEGPAAEPALQGHWRSLVVDDDTNERELLAGVLGMNGCQADTAADGQAALDYLASHDRPDFVLLDLLMPGCSGPQALAQIRRNPRFRGLKIFAVSGTSPSELGVDIGPDGFDAWFQKPLNPRSLWDGIQKHLPTEPGMN